VVDVPQAGFLTTMDVSCWSFMRMAHLAEPLMTTAARFHHVVLRQPDGGGQLQHHGRRQGGARMRGALHGRRARPKGIRVHASRPDLWRPARPGHSRVRRAARQGAEKAPARSLVSTDDVGAATAFLALDVRA